MLVSHIAGLAFAFSGIVKAQVVKLRTAKSFAVLAGSTVTNTGSSVIVRDVGVFPGTAITGFPPGVVANGVFHAGDAVADQAQGDVTTAYNDAAGRPPTASLASELGGLTLVAGVYQLSTAQLTGILTLDGQGASNGVWIFQIGTTLTTASASSVILINGALPCNIFWQVGSSATIGTGTTFVGNVLALTSITMNTGASSNGGLYARNGAVTLDDNDIIGNPCKIITITTTTTTTTSASTITTPTTTTTTTPTTTTTITTITTPITTTTTTITTPITTTTTPITTTTTPTTTTTTTTPTTTTTTPTTITTTPTATNTTPKTTTTTTKTSTRSTSTHTTPNITTATQTYTATFTTTRTYTITSCAPTVTYCAVGHVTTEIVTSLTTWCPGETKSPTEITTAISLSITVCGNPSSPHVGHTNPLVLTAVAMPTHDTTVTVPGYHSYAHTSETPINTPAAIYPETTSALTVPGMSTIKNPCSTCGTPTQNLPVIAGTAEMYRVSVSVIVALAIAVAAMGM